VLMASRACRRAVDFMPGEQPSGSVIAIARQGRQCAPDCL
jgi:hypothetical protein